MSRSTAAPAPPQRPAGSTAGGRRPSPRRTNRTIVWLAVVVVALLALAGAVAVSLGSAQNRARPPVPGDAGPIVGGDLHTIAAFDDALVVGGHTAAAVSTDDGASWEDIPSLRFADPMGWAVTSEAVLAAGHPGLFRSTDGGSTFEPAPVASGLSDMHALGGAGSTVYLASPQAGLLVSTDGGGTWEVRTEQAGQTFMGTILVDPEDPDRLIAPDMSAGLVTSLDGGLTWTALGGPSGAMSVAWNPTDRAELVAVGMSGAAGSADGGERWQPLDVPAGTSAVTYSPDGGTLYAAALRGVEALTYRSTDGGTSWEPTR